jgi:hypothetical protein
MDKYSLQPSGTAAPGYLFEMINNNTNLFGIALGDGVNWGGGGTVQLKAGVWNHFAFVRRGNRGKWYLNGIEKMDTLLGSDKPVVPATSNFRIGNWVLGTREFNGKIDESFIFSRALEPEEVGSIAERGFENAQAVSWQGKAATTWGKIKSWHQ